jgi:hypothetical protein
MERAFSTGQNFFMILGTLRAHGMSPPTILRARGSIASPPIRHMYLGFYCKSQSCGQFHLVHYIGLTPQTRFGQADGWWDYLCPRCRNGHRYVGSDLANLLSGMRRRQRGSHGFSRQLYTHARKRSDELRACYQERFAPPLFCKNCVVAMLFTKRADPQGADQA